MAVRARPLLASWLSLSLALLGCNKTEETSEAKADGGAEAKADGGEAKADGGEAQADGGETKPQTPATDPAELTAAVEAMVEVEATYPVALDPLLDLLPADAPTFMVIRDVDDLLAVADATLVPVGPAMRTFAGGLEARGEASGATADVEKFLDGYITLRDGLRGPDFDLDRGMALAKVGDGSVVIYGASKPDALPTLFRSMGASGDDMPDECAAVAGAPGYVACASDPAVLAAYAPAKASATLRKALSDHLGGDEALERGNLLAGFDQDQADHMTMSIATPPGELYFTIGVKPPDFDASLVRSWLQAGEAPALSMVAPASGFYWLKLDPAAIARESGDAPFIIKNLLDKLTGEVFLGTLDSPSSIVLLAGVTDPGPAGGLIALAGTQLHQIPPSLPDGTKITAALEGVKVRGKDVQTVHVTLEPSGPMSGMFAGMGMKPEAWFFAAGNYVGVALGADKSVIERIGTHAGGTMQAETARGLPKALAQGVAEGKVASVAYLALDGFQSPSMKPLNEKIAKQVASSGTSSETEARELITMVQAAIAPLSGISWWIEPPAGDVLVIHSSLSLLGDPRTPEGADAIAAMGTALEGRDASAAFKGLAAKHSGSARAMAYRARAGELDAMLLTTAGLMGMLLGISLPAFEEYRTRAEAARVMPPMTAP